MARILLWESLIIIGISLASGLLCGILFSKIAELCMVHVLHGNINYSFLIEPSTIVNTLILFTVIFMLLLLNTLRQIHVSKPIELLHGDTVGEKPPKSNWVLALFGVLFLAWAYYLAITIEKPLAALTWFFIAVLLVMVATYFLFVAGSVVFCRLLQKTKKYYYHTNHFISVSSMVYRMKRNGAGLASICILSTMVLVMISSTACLYLGTEDSLKDRFPRDVVIDIYSTEPEHVDLVHENVEQVLRANELTAKDIQNYRILGVTGCLNENNFFFRMTAQASPTSYDNLIICSLVTLDDYNKMTNKHETLSQNEVLVYFQETDYAYDCIDVESCPSLEIKKVIPEPKNSGWGTPQAVPCLFLIVPDPGTVETIYNAQCESYGKAHSIKREYYSFNLEGKAEQQIKVYKQLESSFKKARTKDNNFPQVLVESIADKRDEFYTMHGGFFSLGIMLGIVFIFATVLIMYYKQISEGYEDKARFEIMQKVGMTKKEIRKSINSQVLTVFFLPLVTAGVHIGFAFPVITKLLILFNVSNTRLLIIVTICCFLIFALFYALVYRITSGAYYGIVSGAGEK